jgi:hypothetical protein
MENLEKLATYVIQDEEKQNKTQHNICSPPLYKAKQAQHVAGFN